MIGTKVKESRNFAAVIYPLHFFISWRKHLGRLAYGYGSKIRNNVSENEVGTISSFTLPWNLKNNNYLPIQEIALSFTSWSISEAFSLTKQH